MDKAAKELFTPTSILTFGGVSAAVWIFSQVVLMALEKNSPLLSLVIAQAVSFVGAYAGHALRLEAVSIFLALVNGCLLFLTAAGGQEAISNAATPKPVGPAVPRAARSVKWSSSWFD